MVVLLLHPQFSKVSWWVDIFWWGNFYIDGKVNHHNYCISHLNYWKIGVQMSSMGERRSFVNALKYSPYSALSTVLLLPLIVLKFSLICNVFIFDIIIFVVFDNNFIQMHKHGELFKCQFWNYFSLAVFNHFTHLSQQFRQVSQNKEMEKSYSGWTVHPQAQQDCFITGEDFARYWSYKQADILFIVSAKCLFQIVYWVV